MGKRISIEQAKALINSENVGLNFDIDITAVEDIPQQVRNRQKEIKNKKSVKFRHGVPDAMKSVKGFQKKEIDEYNPLDWVHYFNFQLRNHGGRFPVNIENSSELYKAKATMESLRTKFSAFELKTMIDFIMGYPQFLNGGYTINSISISMLRGGWIPIVYAKAFDTNSPSNAKEKTKGEWNNGKNGSVSDDEFFDA